jgi:hypothetical protein
MEGPMNPQAPTSKLRDHVREVSKTGKSCFYKTNPDFWGAALDENSAELLNFSALRAQYTFEKNRSKNAKKELTSPRFLRVPKQL